MASEPPPPVAPCVANARLGLASIHRATAWAVHLITRSLLLIC